MTKRRFVDLPTIPWWRAKSAGQVHFLYASPKHPSVNVKAFVALAIELLPSISRRVTRGGSFG
jgi:hypothetical protein